MPLSKARNKERMRQACACVQSKFCISFKIDMETIDEVMADLEELTEEYQQRVADAELPDLSLNALIDNEGIVKTSSIMES